MRPFVVSLATAGTLAALASPLVSPLGQTYPGQATQARVWIQNRGHDQAVPVDLRDANMNTPLRVQVVNGDPATRVTNAALVRLGRQQWEYATVRMDDVAQAGQILNERGTDGWETTGIAWTSGSTTTLLLKRPR
jgi:hypothetical protein